MSLTETATPQADTADEIIDPAVDVAAPRAQAAPLVFASPHSGRVYPERFKARARLDALTLRNSEDAFVDELYAAAPDLGVPLLKANFPRAYVDPNREPYELDPDMFADPLPDYVNARSRRVRGGLGTIARVVTNGREIYDGKLSFAEAETRLKRYYFPYHRTLRELLVSTRTRFGAVLLVDCHSMPSIGGPMDRDPGSSRVDFVLGDRFGASCAPGVTDLVEEHLSGLGYNIARNRPYAGGYITEHYGRPESGVHVLQIEINRALYMDEDRIEKLPEFQAVARDLEGLVGRLAAESKTLLGITRDARRRG